MRHSAHVGINVSARTRRAASHSAKETRRAAHAADRKGCVPLPAIWNLIWFAAFVYFVLDLLVFAA